MRFYSEFYLDNDCRKIVRRKESGRLRKLTLLALELIAQWIFPLGELMPKSLLLIALACLLSLSSGCETKQMWTSKRPGNLAADTKVVEQSFNSVLVSSDYKYLVLLQEEYHYFFEVPDKLAKRTKSVE